MSGATTIERTPAEGSGEIVSLAPDGRASVRRARRLRGTLRVPGDKSISHRALLLAALASGTSTIDGASDGADVRTTARLVAELGAAVERTGDGGVSADSARDRLDRATASYVVSSPGVDDLREPSDVLDCGNSGTSLRLLAGVLAARPFTTVLTGDASLRRRPVGRVIRPLARMGATLLARGGGTVPPLTIAGTTPLRAIAYETEVPSAQVKSAILLAALRADGETEVTERVATRDHTERMLRARGVRIERELDDTGAARIRLSGGQDVATAHERVPGDPSSAAFWLVAGSIHPDADVTVENVGVNPTRIAFVELLRRMGADIEIAATDGPVETSDVGEPTARIRARSSTLRAIDIDASDVAAAIDEIPVLCLAATQATGTTRIRDAGELRVKESDRLTGIAEGLATFGARVAVDGDTISITGPSRLHGAQPDSRLDHRLAMTFAIAALLADGASSIGDTESVAISYPTFFADLEGVVS